MKEKLIDILEQSPIISAVTDAGFEDAIKSPSRIIFYLKASLLSVADRIKSAHNSGKLIFVHIDLADGIGKDRAGIEFLQSCGVDGIISTRVQIIRTSKDLGLFTVQRFFAFDSQGLESTKDLLESANPDMMEIMPGVICKAIKRFSGGRIAVIAGGLIETKAEVTAALSSGAVAVSTGKSELWEL